MNDNGGQIAGLNVDPRQGDTPGLSSGLHASRLFVIGGAALSFGASVSGYFSGDEYFGLHQSLALIASLAVVAVGAVLEVRAGRRPLTEALQFWSVAALVVLVCLVIRLYQIESRAFYEFVAPLTAAGFIIHHYLPDGLRKPFFVFLSLIGVAGVFGAVSPLAALALVGGGMTLIGVCHLPVPIWARVLVLLTCAGLLAALRFGWLYEGWIAAVLPILASIFMFRLIVYLYDLANGKGPKDFWGRIGYFFMLPNLVFPFFPVVDSAAFARSYYNDNAIRIYRRGASYILRGLIHLLLYRVVHVYLLLVPDQVSDPLTFLQYIASNFGLYLKVSGLFHLTVGLLLLFGYNLPETHSRFYFSNSFIDFWRRINIYWKDFMQKMVFNPSYMQFKRTGASHLVCVSLSIAVVFIVTWALHAYQWFWLTGQILFTTTDTLFWAILGVFLIIQTVLEARPKKPATDGFVGVRTFLVLRTVCTMFTISLLWSFWTSHTAEDWFGLVSRSGLVSGIVDPAGAGLAGWATTIAFLVIVSFAVLITIGITFGLPKASQTPARRPKPALHAPAKFFRAAALAAAPLVALAIVQAPNVGAFMPSTARDAATKLASAQLNQQDVAMLERGYYEGLTSSQRYNPELWEFFVDAGKDERAPRQDYQGVHFVGNYLDREFVPNTDFTVAGVTTHINEWGMDAASCSLKKPPGTYRIAMIGDSRARGWGVHREERFPNVVEDLLNEKYPTGKYNKYEILNFSMDGYVPIQRLMMLDEKALKFQPDAVFYIAGRRDIRLDHAISMIRENIDPPYPFIGDVYRRAGVDASMSEAEIQRRLEPFVYEMVDEIYTQMASELRSLNLPLVWIYVPNAMDHEIETGDMADHLKRLAEKAGFTVIDLVDIFAKSENPGDYRLSRWDDHPNAKGHRLLGEAIVEKLEALDRTGKIDMALEPAGNTPGVVAQPSPQSSPNP